LSSRCASSTVGIMCAIVSEIYNSTCVQLSLLFVFVLFFMFRVYKLILDFYFCSHLSILAGWGRCGCYAVLRSELGFGVDRRVGSYICCVWRKKVDRPAMAGDECTIPIKPMLLFCLSACVRYCEPTTTTRWLLCGVFLSLLIYTVEVQKRLLDTSIAAHWPHTHTHTHIHRTTLKTIPQRPP